MSFHHSLFKNESVLVPEYLPPTTPHRGVQMRELEAYFQGVAERPQSVSQNVLLHGPVGCHRKGQLVLMFDGSLKRVEDISEGDVLMGPDSAPRKVLETVRGFGKMVKVRPAKGKSFVVSEDHILTIIQTRLKKHPRKPSEDTEGIIKDIRVSELLKAAKWRIGPKGLYKLLRTGVDFPQTPMGPIDPYFLGVYLGDGSSANGLNTITSAEPEIVSVVNNQSEKYLLKIHRYPAGQAQEYYLTPGRTGGQTLRNGLARDLIALGLYKKTGESKFIPSQYKFGSRRTRLEVLAGILDTDGHLENGCYDFVTGSRQLAEDVAFVSRSLGFYAFLREKYSYDQFGHGGLYWRVGISGEVSKIPTRVSRKQASPRRQKKSVLRTAFTLEPLGEEEYFGFRVDADQRYLLDDFTVTHNSGKTMLAKKLGVALEKRAAGYGNRVKFLHVNCRIDRSLVAIFNKALRNLGHTYPSRGLSFEELLQALFEELRRDRVHMLVAFDEVDSLVESDPSSLYTITRIREISQDAQAFSSILISKTLDYVKMVDLSTLSSLQRNAISLEPYSGEQLYDILLSRSQLAFREGCIDDASLQMAAELASIFGDARYAIELIHRAGTKAEMADAGRVIPEHVRLAKEGLPPEFRKEELVYLDKHERVMLMAISNVLKKSDSEFTTIGEVEKSYNALCESMGLTPNHHTQVWNDVNELARKGIIDAQLSGKGFRGRTTMIGLSRVSAEHLIEELHKEA
jgi:orc1/cdc6 family replication initiation protein